MPGHTAVLLCNCGESLKNIDFGLLRRRLEQSDETALVVVGSKLCLGEGMNQIVTALRGHKIDRTVVAACASLQKEALFRKALKQAGLKAAPLSVANIREQCCWAHDGDVTEKALELIGMAASRARLQEAMLKHEVDVTPEALIVGGGRSGMKSALSLSALGLKATLVEDASQPGGDDVCFNGPAAGENLAWVANAVAEDENIEVLTSARIVRIEGQAGNFCTTIRGGDEQLQRNYGAIVVAVEGRKGVLPPELEEIPNIISQQRLVGLLRATDRLPARPHVVAFLLDSFGENSRSPTLCALNNALATKKRLGSEVYVFCRHLKVDSSGAEALYREARDQGVTFVKFDQQPTIQPSDDRVSIQATDLLLGSEMILLCDLLGTDGMALPPKGAQNLSSILKAGAHGPGFCQDDNVHLYPVFSRRKGVFFVGGCDGDQDPCRAETDVYNIAVAVRALLSKGKVTVDAEKVKAEPDQCRACLTCIRVCPHSAIRLVRSQEGGAVAQVNDLACDGCGICCSICPAKAIKFAECSEDQILSQLEAIQPGRIVAFCCAESACQAADKAGRMRIRYPSAARIIPVPCAGRVDVLHILKAIEKGAAGVLVMACPEGSCRHLDGTARAENRTKHVQNLLADMGIDSQQIRMTAVGPDMAWRFAQEVREMWERVGPTVPRHPAIAVTETEER